MPLNTKFLLRRTSQGVMTVVTVVTISFLLVHLLPGGLYCILYGGGSTLGGECNPPPGALSGPTGMEIAIMVGLIAFLLILAAGIQTALE